MTVGSVQGNAKFLHIESILPRVVTIVNTRLDFPFPAPGWFAGVLKEANAGLLRRATLTHSMATSGMEKGKKRR